MSNETTALAEDRQTYRLPVQVLPEHYDLRLTPDLNKFTFTGSETIRVTVLKPVTKIILNAAELSITQAHLDNGKGREFAAQITYDKDNEQATFIFPEIETISAGNWHLHIDFEGILNDKLHGFYRSSYKNDKGEQKMLATTQFEATDARRAFPCFDEPQLKAIFKTTLIVDPDLTAISNAGIASEKLLPNGKKEVTFKETIKMSTYLVAFIVGEFEGTEPVMVDKTPIRIWSCGKKHLSKFAIDSACASLTFFNKYYGIPYPGDKLDLIAIPDFASGAMENLGAVTFRENALLVDEKTASISDLERIADVIAHELAHMWFGDLVTMKWWNGLWLNEAFATFMEMMAVDAWKPNWKRWDSFGASRAAAYGVDGLKSTRTIEFPVKHPDEAGAMFDILTYEKGASVLRMLEQYLGVEEFRKGISLYLNKHKFANAETTDLWDALEESSKQPVRQMMDSWIFQEGHPVISLDLDEAGKGLHISQERFFYLQEKPENNQLFHIPVILKVKTNKGIVNKKFILSDKKAHIELDGNIEWVVANAGGHGFYRVRYSNDLLTKLTKNIQGNLNVIERFNLVSDTWATVVAGLSPLKNYLQLIELFKNEPDKNVWTIIIGSLNYLNKIIDLNSRKNLELFTCNLVRLSKERLGLQKKDGEDDLTSQLRGMLLATMGGLGNDPKVQIQARELYGIYRHKHSAVDPNLVSPLVSIIAASGGEKEYQEFYQEFKNAKTPQDEQRYLFVLASFRKPELLKRTLAMTITSEVRTQNAPYLVQATMANPYGRNLAWDFLKQNWDKMNELYPENSIPRMCEGITSLVLPELEKDIQQFFATHKVKQGDKTISQHLEKLHVAILFKERESNTLAAIS